MSDCPRCFRKLAHDRKAFRCTSGKCGVEFQEATVEVLGFQVASTRIVVADDPRQLPGSISCSRCGEYEQQEVCLHCYADIPQNWRSANVLTVTIAGARGAGKTVYIGVLIEVLRRYLKRIGRILEAVNRSTDDTYNAVYRVPLFEENMMLPGTKPIVDDAFAPQRTTLLWHIPEGGAGQDFYIAIRDMAGEDLERATERSAALSYVAHSDLVIFLFDPTILDNIMGLLDGLIPTVERGRLGMSAEDAFSRLLRQMSKPGSKPGKSLALAVSKFDTLQQLPKADNSYTEIMANPSAHFNRDDTMREYLKKPRDEVRQKFLDDIDFLDREIHSLFVLLQENMISNLADGAKNDGKFQDVRRFAVSAVGEPPKHVERLTQRGISPFRVLDPLLWGLTRKGLWI